MPTALVTGASQGIGEAFARALAARGSDLVLTARNQDALERLAQELRGRGRSVEVVVADLADPAGLALVEARINDAAAPPIDLLVNNAGFGTTGRFHELPLDAEDSEIRVNALAVVRLAHAALQGMAERGSGGIINVSSIAGFQPVPGNATYCATKSFVTTFSLALHEEYRTQGVTVLCVAPGATRTEWQARAGFDESSIPAFAWQTAEAVALGALAAFDARRALYTSGWTNKALAAATHLAPRALLARVTGMVSRQV